MSRCLKTFPLPPALLQRLTQCGFETQRDVMNETVVHLSHELSISHEAALDLMNLIRQESNNLSSSVDIASGLSAIQFVNCTVQKHRPIITLCQDLDELLGGGIHIGELTEICGVPGIGKTQMGIQLACSVQIPEEFGGTGGDAIYVDTEGSFMAERAAEVAFALSQHIQIMTRNRPTRPNQQIAAANFSRERILSSIHYYRVHNHVELLSCVRTLPDFLKTRSRIRLLLIDSVAFHFRSDFTDMGLRSRMLRQLAQDLSKIAHENQVAVVLVNQVTTRFNDKSNAVLVPALGESWAHTCTNRLMMYWMNDIRWARLVKSPSRPDACVPFSVTTAGIRGAKQDGNKRKREMDPTGCHS